ncbi:hypothetical protein HY642_05620 [Candidatus Woesearchaeota archaeon]|nr:hypothetical protein [Candidatus Woesearchaeota archaeon]
MHTINVPLFNLPATLECGQFFRYAKAGKWYYVVHGDRLFKIRQAGDKCIFTGVDAAFIKSFFRLDDNLEAIYRAIDTDKHMHDAIRRYRGLRLIRQQPWECAASFVLSQVSNIPRIRRNMEDLSKCLGRQVSLSGYLVHSFPRAGELTAEHLQACRVGFRDKYLLALNKMFTTRFVNHVKAMPYEHALAALTTIPGIGDKVASCILLYSFDRLESFPVDVWMQRTMRKYYFKNRKVNNKEIIRFAQKRWGQYAGYAQQYLYHWGRNSRKL